MRSVAVSVLGVLAACGGSTSAATVSEASSNGASGPRGGTTPELAVQLCHMNGAPERTDYPYVASFECPDGTRPLGGDPRAGAASRLGNVGPGPDGHVLDLYEIPCPTGAVRIYVDAYHCPDDVDLDPNNLSDIQLARMVGLARDLETVPFDPRARELRSTLVEWLHQTPQVDMTLCPDLLEGVLGRGYAHEALLVEQLIASTGAATLELSSDAHQRANVNEQGLLGVLRLYETIVSERGRDDAQPRLDELVAMRDGGRLSAWVAETTEGCSNEGGGLGMTMTNDAGDNVWPPSGDGCAELVACCEGAGMVRDGAAVAGTQGLVCLMAAAPPVDCRSGLTMLQTSRQCRTP